MPTFDINHQFGMEGENVWMLSATEFPAILNMVYKHHFGEIWLFNNNLEMILDDRFFSPIYLEKISKELRSKILSVKIIVTPDQEKHVFSDKGGPSSQMKHRLNQILHAGGPRRLQTIYFGKASEAKEHSSALAKIPSDHSWVFYAHRNTLATPNYGVVIVRPTEFPFHDSERDIQHYAIAWQMQRDHLMRPAVHGAFTKCFHTESLFSHFTAHAGKCGDLVTGSWSQHTVKNARIFARPHSMDSLALGEKATVVVLGSRDSEILALKQLVSSTLGVKVVPVTLPFDTAVWECANIVAESGTTIKVLFAVTGEGLLPAAMATYSILQNWKPTYVIFCGVAGADPAAAKPLHLGDVVFGESVVNYEDGTINETAEPGGWEFEPRNDRNSYPAMDSILFEHADKVRKEWHPSPKDFRAMGVKTKGLPLAKRFNARSTVIGSGYKLVAAGAYFQDMIKPAQGKIDTVEMEAAGVCYACRKAGLEKHILVVRGIMDKANNATRNGPAPKEQRDTENEPVRTPARVLAETASADFVLKLLRKL